MNEIRVSDVMTHLVVTLRRGDSLREAARRLLSNRISGAPIVDQGRLVGVISEADLVAAYSPPARSGSPFAAVDPLAFLLRGMAPRAVHHSTVGDVMSTDVITVSPDSGVLTAASLIDRHGVRRLPVVDKDDLVVGIVTRSDLVRAMARGDVDVSVALKNAIGVLGEESFSGLDIEVKDGIATIGGTADRKSTRDLAIRIAARVPGVLEVVDALGYDWDDENLRPVRNPIDAHDVGSRDPWASGPLVKEGA
ncbi:MAG: CBS domain-containing protein [Actinomycetota bacterium]